MKKGSWLREEHKNKTQLKLFIDILVTLRFLIHMDTNDQFNKSFSVQKNHYVNRSIFTVSHLAVFFTVLIQFIWISITIFNE